MDFEIIYDAEPELEEGAGSVVYDPKPIAERDEPWRAAGLEEMFVDETYKRDPASLHPKTLLLHKRILEAFESKRGQYITFQEVQNWAKRIGFAKTREGYNCPYLVRMLNALWKAGLIRKYRRGLYMSHARLHDGRGESHGITYWFWGND